MVVLKNNIVWIRILGRKQYSEEALSIGKETRFGGIANYKKMKLGGERYMSFLWDGDRLVGSNGKVINTYFQKENAQLVKGWEEKRKMGLP